VAVPYFKVLFGIYWRRWEKLCTRLSRIVDLKLKSRHSPDSEEGVLTTTLLHTVNFVLMILLPLGVYALRLTTWCVVLCRLMYVTFSFSLFPQWAVVYLR
jgi:hypothetical protein